jgi:hypothetical protein
MFRDYILLAKGYGSSPLFHEIALPTMLRILERTYTPHASMSAMQFLGDCWGGCCRQNPSKDDIRDNRCGHKFNWPDWDTTKSHFVRLEENAKLLGTPRPWRAAAGPVPKWKSGGVGKKLKKREVEHWVASEVGLRDAV